MKQTQLLEIVEMGASHGRPVDVAEVSAIVVSWVYCCVDVAAYFFHVLEEVIIAVPVTLAVSVSSVHAHVMSRACSNVHGSVDYVMLWM